MASGHPSSLFFPLCLFLPPPVRVHPLQKKDPHGPHSGCPPGPCSTGERIIEESPPSPGKSPPPTPHTQRAPAASSSLSLDPCSQPVSPNILTIHHRTLTVHQNIRQSTSKYVKIRQSTSEHIIIHQNTSSYISTPHHTSSCIIIHQNTSEHIIIHLNTSSHLITPQNTSSHSRMNQRCIERHRAPG